MSGILNIKNQTILILNVLILFKKNPFSQSNVLQVSIKI